MVDQWIDVNDALPRDFRVYLVVYCRNNVKINVLAWYNPKMCKWGRKGREMPEGNLITHWLKLENPVN
jgi:hypothetical protein